MCTVTFLPAGETIYLTSNRDERTTRTAALPPAVYEFPQGRILFPKDGKAQGTWIAVHRNGHAMVLLNGAFERHEPLQAYRKSRGLVFLDIIDALDPVAQFSASLLDGIEPFTLVLYGASGLWEMRWDGKKQHLLSLPKDVPRIWSSVTLYDKETIAKREQWFTDWLQSDPKFEQQHIQDFHRFKGEGDKRSAILMQRDDVLKTISITSIALSSASAKMHYTDYLRDGLQTISEWIFAEPGI